jgi:hypothetical protein
MSRNNSTRRGGGTQVCDTRSACGLVLFGWPACSSCRKIQANTAAQVAICSGLYAYGLMQIYAAQAFWLRLALCPIPLNIQAIRGL